MHNFVDMNLAQLQTGQKAVIVRVGGSGAFRKRILEMGFVQGKEIMAVHNAPLRDPIYYKILDYNVSLRHRDAERIEVRLLEPFEEQTDVIEAPQELLPDPELHSLQRMELGEPDASGRRRPVPVEGAVETIDVDEVIVSVGVSPNPLIPQAFAGLEISKRGTIIVGEADMRSSLADVYAGGDIVRGGATVILAMGDGRRAAAAMDEALQERKS